MVHFYALKLIRHSWNMELLSETEGGGGVDLAPAVGERQRELREGYLHANLRLVPKPSVAESQGSQMAGSRLRL